MRQYVKVLVFLLVVVFVGGIFGCGSKTEEESFNTLRITENAGNQFRFAIRKSAFPNPVGTVYLWGLFTNWKLNISLTEQRKERGSDIIWLESDYIYMAGQRQLNIGYKTGSDIILPVIPSNEPGYNFNKHCWEIDFSQASYEFLEPGKYKVPTPIRLARASVDEVGVEINAFYFYDPQMSFPVYLSGEWDWDVKIPHYPDEQGFIQIVLTSETVKDDFNLSWFDGDKEVWMNLAELKRQGFPCIKGGTEDKPATWNIGSDWENLLPVTLTDPNAWVVPHVCADSNQCCCMDDADIVADNDAEADADIDSNCTCPECQTCDGPDISISEIDPTEIQDYGNGIHGDNWIRSQYKGDGKWNFFFKKSAVPEDQQVGEAFLRGTFNNWKSTISLVDSSVFVGWLQTKNPIFIDPGQQRLNFIFEDFYANHSRFLKSLFHLEYKGDFSFGIVVPELEDAEKGDYLTPWN